MYTTIISRSNVAHPWILIGIHVALWLFVGYCIVTNPNPEDHEDDDDAEM